MSTSASESTPLLRNRSNSVAVQPESAQAAAESAIASAFADPNASAFAVPPPQIDEGDEEEAVPAAAVPEGVLVTETPMRADLFIVLGGLWVGTFLSALDGTIVATVLSVIGSEFEVSNSISWLGTSYLLTQTAFQPLYGRGSDIFGRKYATLFASVIFGIGSLGCGLAKTYPQLIAARAFAGIGGGGLTTMSSIVTSDLVPLRKRGVYQGLGNVVYAGGAAIGGPLGGWLGDGIGWRWGFLIQIPLCILHFVIVFWKVDIPSGPGDMMTKLKRIDYLGSVMLIAGVALLLVGLSLGGNQEPWDSPIVYGAIIAGIVVLIAFVLVETYVAKEPLLAPRILFSKTPGFVSLTNFAITMSQFAIIFSIPLYFSAVEQTTTSYAGLHLIPNAVFASTCSLLAGIYMSKTGRYRVMLITMGFLGVLGPFTMIFWDRKTTPQFMYWVDMIPNGVAYGGILTITLVALISAVEPKDMAASTGVSYLARATGSVLGIALSTAILQNQLSKELPKYIGGKKAVEIIAKIREDVSYIHTLPTDLRNAAIAAYQTSMRAVFIATTVAAAMALVSLLFIEERELPGRLDRKK